MNLIKSIQTQILYFLFLFGNEDRFKGAYTCKISYLLIITKIHCNALQTHLIRSEYERRDNN